MKLRGFEKIFMCLINTAVERYGESQHDCKMRTQFELEVTDCMRKKVYGNESTGRPCQWKFKWKEGNRGMEKPSMNGSNCTKFMMGLSVLASTIYKEELDQEPGKDETPQVVRFRNERKLQSRLAMAENIIPLWTLI
jgi:hypothetical protein